MATLKSSWWYSRMITHTYIYIYELYLYVWICEHTLRYTYHTHAPTHTHNIHTYITLHYITLHYITLHYIICILYIYIYKYLFVYLYLFTCMRIQAHAPWWSSWHCESALRLGLNGRAKRAKAVDYRTYWDVTVTVIEKYLWGYLWLYCIWMNMISNTHYRILMGEICLWYCIL